MGRVIIVSQALNQQAAIKGLMAHTCNAAIMIGVMLTVVKKKLSVEPQAGQGMGWITPKCPELGSRQGQKM